MKFDPHLHHHRSILGRGEASLDQSDWQPWYTIGDASPLHRPAGTSLRQAILKRAFGGKLN